MRISFSFTWISCSNSLIRIDYSIREVDGDKAGYVMWDSYTHTHSYWNQWYQINKLFLSDNGWWWMKWYPWIKWENFILKRLTLKIPCCKRTGGLFAALPDPLAGILWRLRMKPSFVVTWIPNICSHIGPIRRKNMNPFGPWLWIR